MDKQLKDLFPILAIEQDCILSKQGDVTIAFRAILPEIFTLSDEEYELLHQCWIRAIKLLPPHTVVHKQDWFLQDEYQTAEGTRKTFLQEASYRHFQGRGFLRHDCYIYLTQKPKNRKPANSAFTSLLRPSIVPPELLNPAIFREFTA